MTRSCGSKVWVKISSGGETYSTRSLAGAIVVNGQETFKYRRTTMVSLMLPSIKGTTWHCAWPLLHCLPDPAFPVNSLSTPFRGKLPIVNYVKVYRMLCDAKKSENVHCMCVLWSSVVVDTAWQLHGCTGWAGWTQEASGSLQKAVSSVDCC